MKEKALGLIETIGLVSAIEAADAAVKAANVTLLGYENTRGGGKITVKFVGEVGAVTAGVAAGVAAAMRVGQVYGHLVIPRPHDEIEALVANLDRGRGRARETEEENETVVTETETVLSEPAAAASEPVPAEPAPQFATMLEPPMDLEATAEPEVLTCAAITKSGERCKLPAQPGSAYCFVHRKQTQDVDVEKER